METKVCKDCELEKPVSEFYEHKKQGGYQSYCKPCHYDRTKERSRWSQIKKNYGISQVEYEEMLEAQNGVCAICGEVEKEHRKNLSVDHDHETGKVRGLLCHPCNIGLGKFRDDKSILKSAISYLSRFSSGTNMP